MVRDDDSHWKVRGARRAVRDCGALQLPACGSRCGLRRWPLSVVDPAGAFRPMMGVR